MIYILGGRGFVGSALVRLCQARSLVHAVVEYDNYREFVGSRCDVLINANGNSKKFLAKENPLEEFALTVRSVRASLVDFRADYYVHLSTCDVYTDCSSPATTRESLVPDVARQSAYGFHKYLAEQCVRHAAPRWLIVRLGGMVGPGMRKNPVFDILNEQPLWLDPASELQFLHTDAVAGLLFGLIDRREKGGRHHLPERPGGCFAQMVPATFFPPDRNVAGQIVNLCGKGVVRLDEIARLAGKPVRVQPGSPKVRYEVSTEKLETMQPVPRTRETLGEFMQQWNDIT